MTHHVLEFHDFWRPPINEQQMEAARFVMEHYRVCDENGSLEWVRCGYFCTHEQP